MTIRIKLVACNRLSYKSEVFEKGFFYDLEDAKARELLSREDDFGHQFFLRVEQPIDSEEMVVEESQSEELDGVKITRKRGRPRKNPAVRSGGDASPLEAEDARKSVVAEDGIEV